MTSTPFPSAPSQSQPVRSAFLQEIIARGYIHQATDLSGLDQLMSNQPIAAYTGFDCTAKSLHVGSLLQIMLLRRLQQHGHQPIILMGSATTMIGDPSDKQEMRKMLTSEEIAENKASIAKIFRKALRFDGPNPAIMVDNRDWLGQLGYLELLRDCGRHFSINRMLTFDSVRLRLEREQSLTFLEFNYMILQARDFVELHRRHGCTLQFGGSEQWGNIVSGIDLGHKMDAIQLFGLTTPLITTSDGGKMGKTAKGAVWLNDDMISAYDFWQFWRNVSDSDVIRFLKIYTDLPLSQIDDLAKLQGQELNEAKILLANQVTALCHSPEAATQAAGMASEAFNQGIVPSEMTHDIRRNFAVDGPLPLYELLVEIGICPSNSTARQLIRGGAVRVNGEICQDDRHKITGELAAANPQLKLVISKKHFALVRFNSIS